MNQITVKGIIIKETNVGEADKIFTIFTETHGKISASAKGVRKYKSKLVCGAQFLSYSEFVLFRGSTMYRMCQTQPLHSFSKIRNSLEKLSCAVYFADLVYDTSEEKNPNMPLLKLFLNTLYILSEKDIPEMLLKTIFEIKLMSIIGYSPNLSNCTDCGSNDELLYFSPADGGVYCNECKIDNSDNIEISNATLAALRHIVECPDNQLFSFTASEKVINQLNLISEKFIYAHLCKQFKSLKYLKDILAL